MKKESLHRPTKAVISLAAFAHNLREIKKRNVTKSLVMGVVKANAYGHGAVQVARFFKKQKVDWLAVATVEEAIELRQAKVTGPLLVLDGLLTETPEIFAKLKMHCVIHSMSELATISKKLKGKSISVFLKFDTGMGRLGFFPSQLDEVLKKVSSIRGLHVEGIMTHLACADTDEAGPTDLQYDSFEELKLNLKNSGCSLPLYSIANSAAIIDRDFENFNLLRPGIMLYGAYPNPRHQSKISLKAPLTLSSKIISLKKFKSQMPISYGGTFVTNRDSVIAVVPIGYADGLPRSLSNKGYFLVNGKRCPIVGRVCMDLTMIDVTDLPQVKCGDEVVIIGRQKNETISAEEVAALAGTISYEIFCALTKRVTRIHK